MKQERERVGEYLISRMLGEGGMGKVYEAEERLSGRRVALKIMRPEVARTEDGRRLFLSEMQILARLEHPSIVRSLASFEHEGQLVLVLEYLDGSTLRDELVRRERLPWPEAISVTCQIAEALTVAHASSADRATVVHRDLKPENVMRVQGGGLKVMDFGIAKIMALAGGRATSSQSLGTLQYMSPEQIDAGSVDGRTDLYALGLVLYEMLAGKAPFTSSSPRELLNLQCTAEPPPLPEAVRRSLPRGVDALLRSLLAKRPEDRPASAAEVLERLAPFRSDDDDRSLSSPKSSQAAPPTPSPAQNAAESSKGIDLDAPEGEPRSDRAADRSMTSTQRSRLNARTPGKESTEPAASGPRADTIALLERSSAPREYSPRSALAFIVAVSLLSAAITYGIRVQNASSSSFRSAAPTLTSAR